MGGNTLIFEIDSDRKETHSVLFSGSCWTAENSRKAADVLMRGFYWGRTKEGVKFWAYVHRRLIEISEILPDQEEQDGIEITVDGIEYIAIPVLKSKRGIN